MTQTVGGGQAISVSAGDNRRCHGQGNPFRTRLADADLTVEAIYEGGTAGNTADDPLAKLVPVGNQGGFRYAGSPKKDDLRLVVLYTSGADRDWPEYSLDRETGMFTYFGDNREPGNRVCARRVEEGTPSCAHAFTASTAAPRGAMRIPPFLIFNRASQAGGRDVR